MNYSKLSLSVFVAMSHVIQGGRALSYHGKNVGRTLLKRYISNSVTTSEIPATESSNWQMNFHSRSDGVQISPWHDVPLANGEYFNFISEIPKFTKAKMEVNTKAKLNPIQQDMKKGKLRDYYGPIFWNYGCLPQTWENPEVLHPTLNCKGDNDPLDVVEIGSKALQCGSITQVKVLGVLAMIDDGELDWKLIAIDVNDPLSQKLSDITDLETSHPEVISGIREWFRWYKTPDGKPLNQYGFKGEVLPKAMALEVIEETNHYWKDLVTGHVENKDGLWLPLQYE